MWSIALWGEFYISFLPTIPTPLGKTFWTDYSGRSIIRAPKSHQFGLNYRAFWIIGQRPNPLPKQQLLTVVKFACKKKTTDCRVGTSETRMSITTYLCHYCAVSTHFQMYWWSRDPIQLCDPRYLQLCHRPVATLVSLGLACRSHHQSFWLKIS